MFLKPSNIFSEPYQANEQTRNQVIRRPYIKIRVREVAPVSRLSLLEPVGLDPQYLHV